MASFSRDPAETPQRPEQGASPDAASSLGARSSRRNNPKYRDARASDQERRRRMVMERQKEQRRNLTNYARHLALGDGSPAPGGAKEGGEEVCGMEGGSEVGDAAAMEVGRDRQEEEEMTGSNGSSTSSGRRVGQRKRALAMRRQWCGSLTTPEWMLDVPEGLNGKGRTDGQGWFVMPRPEGKRCIVIAAKGVTVARLMNGNVFKRWTSALPGGSHQTNKGCDGYCILDCVYHELDKTFYVLDMMSWKGYPLYDCVAEFRLYWVRTKLAETLSPLDVVNRGNAYRIVPTLYQECDSEGLRVAYQAPPPTVPFIRDGLLFFAKGGHYALGVSPLVLLWKDSQCTRYLLGAGEDRQSIVLKVGKDSGGGGKSTESTPLVTSDGVCLGGLGTAGPLPASSSPSWRDVAEGELWRCHLDGAAEIEYEGDDREPIQQQQQQLVIHQQEEEGGELQGKGAPPRKVPVVKGLTLDKKCSLARPDADSWSKILFQARLRTGDGALDISDLIAEATAHRGGLSDDGMR